MCFMFATTTPHETASLFVRACAICNRVNEHRLESFVPVALDNQTAALFEHIGISSGFDDSYGILAGELGLCKF